MKLFRITEDDLVALEHILPLVFWKLTCTPKAQPEDRVQFRRVQKILTDIRWDYGPPEEVAEIPTNDGGEA